MTRIGRRTTVLLSAFALIGLGVSALGMTSAGAVKGGNNGTTLAGYKTIDICQVNDTTWRYSGEIAVWNTGVSDTQGFAISDFIEYKTATKFVKAYDVTVTPSGEIPAGTTLETATVFPYSIDAAPLSGTIRNNASLTILNHSGNIGTPYGPNPKATYDGTMPPPACATTQQGVYTQGYWETSRTSCGQTRTAGLLCSSPAGRPGSRSWTPRST